MTVEIRDERFAAVVGREVTFEKIAGDCIFTEGPLWHPRDRFLLWSDMPGDHLRRWSAKDGEIVPVDLPRPRERGSPEFLAIARRVERLVKEEVLKTGLV
jgi:gluconolactonase